MNEYAGGAGFFDTPLLRWLGSKWKIADWIIAQFPPHVSYVEPYCGGASVFFRKRPSSIETLNDLNGDLVHFFDMLRTRPDDLIRAIELSPYAREEYDRYWAPAPEDCDPIERARRFYIGCWMTFQGEGRHKSGWRWRRMGEQTRSNIPREFARVDGLYFAVQRLKMAQIENRDALEVIHRYDDRSTLFYVDPPYVLSARSDERKRYNFEMTDDDHRALHAQLHAIEGMAIISGYDSTLYDELYADWRKLTKTATTNGNGTSTEVLWLSPRVSSMNHLPLFEVQP